VGFPQFDPTDQCGDGHSGVARGYRSGVTRLVSNYCGLREEEEFSWLRDECPRQLSPAVIDGTRVHLLKQSLLSEPWIAGKKISPPTNARWIARECVLRMQWPENMHTAAGHPFLQKGRRTLHLRLFLVGVRAENSIRYPRACKDKH